MLPLWIPGRGFGGGRGEKGDQGDPGPAGSNGATGAAGQNGYGVRTADGRLTTVSGTPILTSNQLAKTTLYYTPFVGNQIALYSSGAWSVVSFSEVSLSLSGYTASRNYDIWGYNNAGSLTLESTIWTNDTTRGTALATQDGVYVKSGDATRRYLGTIRINSTGGQIDWQFGAVAAGCTEAKFTIWNESNRVFFSTFFGDSTNSWTHGNDATWAAQNGSATARASFIVGRQTEIFEVETTNRPAPAASTAGAVAIGLDSTSTPASNQKIMYNANGTSQAFTSSKWTGFVSPGHHYLQALDYSTGGTTTLYGDNGFAYLQTGTHFEGYF